MGYKDPNDERRIQKDFEYMNSERGYVTRTISSKFKPSYTKYGGHIPNIDKKEWAYHDIEKYFESHRKIMDAYKEALQRLHD